MRKQAVDSEFEVQGNTVLHVPTNARFNSYPGNTEIKGYNMGHLGSVLPNGDDYEEDTVFLIAKRLMKARPKP
jgi:hypothetical protein